MTRVRVVTLIAAAALVSVPVARMGAENPQNAQSPQIGEPLPSQQVMDFQKKFLDDLAAKAKSVTGTKDAAGNFVVKDGKMTGDGTTVSPTTVNGLILTKDTYISDLDAWVAELERLKSLPLSEKEALIYQWMGGKYADDTPITRLMATFKKFMQAYYGAKDIHDAGHLAYQNSMAIADELEHKDKENPGTVTTRTGMTAQQWRDAANNTPYGWFVRIRQTFYKDLAANKYLALRKDGQYLFEALYDLWKKDDRKIGDWSQTVNAFIDAGIAEAKAQKAKAEKTTTIEELMKFGGPQYSAQHIKAAAVGKAIGAKLPELQISEVVAVFEGVQITRDENNEYWNTVGESLLNVAMAMSILVPGGQFIAAGIAVIQITHEGKDLVFTYLTEEEARKNASVTGYKYVITAEDKTAAQKNKLFITVVTSIPDLLALGEIRNIKLAKGKTAANAGGAAANAAGTAGRTAAAVDDGLAAIAKEFGQDVADGVAAARTLGIKESEIQAYLKAGTPQPQHAGKTVSELNKMGQEAVDAVDIVGGYRRKIADVKGVEEIIDAARKQGVPEAQIQKALAEAKKANTITAYTEGLAHDLQVAEVNANGGVVLFDREAQPKTKGNLDGLSNAEVLDKYTNTVKPERTIDATLGVDTIDAAIAKVELSMSPSAQAARDAVGAYTFIDIRLTPSEWMALSQAAEYPGRLEKFYKLNPDTQGFTKVFGPGFEQRFEAFLADRARVSPQASAILDKWNRNKKLAAGQVAGPTTALGGAEQHIPPVLRDPATGGYLKPDQIARLTKEDLAKLPQTFALDEHVPEDVLHALSKKYKEYVPGLETPKDLGHVTVNPQPAAPATKIGFALGTAEDAKREAEKVMRQAVDDARKAAAGNSAATGALNNRAGGANTGGTGGAANAKTTTPTGDMIYQGYYGGVGPKDYFALDVAVRTELASFGFKGDFKTEKAGTALVYTHLGTNTPFEVTETPDHHFEILKHPKGSTPQVGLGAKPSGDPIYEGSYGGSHPNDYVAIVGTVTEQLNARRVVGDCAIAKNGDSLVFTNTATNRSFEVNEWPGGNISITEIPAGAPVVRPDARGASKSVGLSTQKNAFFSGDATGFVSIDAQGHVTVTPFVGAPTFPATLLDSGAFALFTPGLTPGTGSPLFVTRAAPLPLDSMTTYFGGGATYSDLTGFTFTTVSISTTRAGRPGGAGGGGSTIDDGPRAVPHAEFGWGAHVDFIPDNKPRSGTVDDPTGTTLNVRYGFGVQNISSFPQFAATVPSNTDVWTFDRLGGGDVVVSEDVTVNFGPPDPLPQVFGGRVFLRGAVPGVTQNVPLTVPTIARVWHTLQQLVAPPTPTLRDLRVPAAFDLSRTRTVSAAPAPTVAAGSVLKAMLVSNGLATGQAFELSVINDSDHPIVLAGDGVVLEAVAPSNQSRAVKQFQDAVKARPKNAPAPTVEMISAYCLEYLKPPPARGTVFRIADSAAQAKFTWMRQILQAEARLEQRRAIVADSDPAAYVDALRQWSLWSYAQHLTTRDSFAKEFVAHTKKNIEAAKQPWNKTVEAQITGLVPHRWDEIQMVLKEAGLEPR